MQIHPQTTGAVQKFSFGTSSTIKTWGVLALFLFLGACASSGPSLISFATESGAVQYFFPMREWKGDSGHISAVSDITYRHEAETSAICNFSFAYTGKTGESVPPLPSEIFFAGDGARYPLSGIAALFSDPQNQQIRVTALLEGENLLAVLRSQTIELYAVFDDTEYRYTPSKDFLSYRDALLAEIDG
jgi:hypothetical protein